MKSNVFPGDRRLIDADMMQKRLEEPDAHRVAPWEYECASILSGPLLVTAFASGSVDIMLAVP